MKTWQFTALDSLFFRGAKPFNSGEGGFLDSQFPPTAQTMAGVIRAAIAESMGVNWQKFRSGEQPDIAALIGADSDDAGKLTFCGPYICKDGQRLYPVPLHLLYSSKEDEWGKLQPAKEKGSLKTDMGEKRLPEVVKPSPEGAKPLENAWLDKAEFSKVLEGKSPSKYYKEEDLFVAESRTGIGRNNEKRQAEPGLLYFTKHIRLKEGVSLAMDVEGADDVIPAKMLRLGGEGRMANVNVSDVKHASLNRYGVGNTAMIILLTHGDFGGEPEPDLAGADIVSACVGKAVREGGWDYKLGQPKPLRSLVPAGSVYFVKGNLSTLETHIGNRTAFGYGEIAVGIWEDKS